MQSFNKFVTVFFLGINDTILFCLTLDERVSLCLAPNLY